VDEDGISPPLSTGWRSGSTPGYADQCKGIYSLMLLLGNVDVQLLFVYFASKNEIPMDAFSITILLGFITIMNWVTVWHTYEHFMYDYRNLARKRWIFEKITKIPVTIRGY
jgi:membrane protein YdbS with pleckstrin-like domain